MSLVDANRMIEPASLVKINKGEASYPGLDRVGEKLGRGLAHFLTGLMSASARVSLKPVAIEENATGPFIARTIRLQKDRGAMQVAFAPATIISLVDLYYGGDGSHADEERHVLSTAENRLLGRLVTAIATLIGSAWLGYGSLEPTVDEEARVEAGPVAVQVLEVTFEGRPPFEVHCRYPVAALERYPALRSSDPAAGSLGGLDDQWQSRLLTKALDITVPVRAIFAEPEVSLETLMDLRAGDVIPVSLPPSITLTVAGLAFARGTAGESNGRSAISIDQF